jgi:hypothetical protein
MEAEDELKLKRAQDYHKDVEIMFAYRLSYSMVAQSMLIVSYTTLLTYSGASRLIDISAINLCIFGLFYTYVQRVLAIGLASRGKFLRENYLMKMDPLFRDMEQARLMPLKGVQTNWIPGALAALWGTLLLIAIAKWWFRP